MSKKCVITIFESAQMVEQIGVNDKGEAVVCSTPVDNLEELNSDYINEHFSDLQDDAYNKGYAQCQDDYSDALKHAKDTAYKKGLHDGESKCGYCNEYQRGLNDAWECGKKLAWTAKYGGYGERLSDVFGRDDTFDFYDYTPNEAIAKLKAYEEKQKEDDKIEVGDEVKPSYSDIAGVVTLVNGDTIYVLWRDGSSTSMIKLKDLCKTGRHFDIASILEEMRHD